ncbi:MAG TPA: Rrf2 family transcriptional regulator [Phycisphaerae bacterium]|nr:Rrf2 family transcriptional regulator [Phycisphaerae bacterium]HRW52714.1 Rrf2 family transcriptional regulator [Phycisphaerae bacterium]
MSLTSEYALRAVVYIAQNEECWPLAGSEIASASGVPSKYLAKILGDLVRHGVLDARRGRGGGFSLARNAKETPLWEVLAPFERFKRTTCPFEDQGCPDASPCASHPRWERVLHTYHGFLKETTIHSIAFDRPSGARNGSHAGKRSRKKSTLTRRR